MQYRFRLIPSFSVFSYFIIFTSTVYLAGVVFLTSHFSAELLGEAPIQSLQTITFPRIVCSQLRLRQTCM